MTRLEYNAPKAPFHVDLHCNVKSFVGLFVFERLLLVCFTNEDFFSNVFVVQFFFYVVERYFFRLIANQLTMILCVCFCAKYYGIDKTIIVGGLCIVFSNFCGNFKVNFCARTKKNKIMLKYCCWFVCLKVFFCLVQFRLSRASLMHHIYTIKSSRV